MAAAPVKLETEPGVLDLAFIRAISYASAVIFLSCGADEMLGSKIAAGRVHWVQHYSEKWAALPLRSHPAEILNMMEV